MRTLNRWLVGYALLLLAFFLQSRLQTWPDARLVLDCDDPKFCQYRGDVSIDFLTGDFRVRVHDGSSVLIAGKKGRILDYEPQGFGIPRTIVMVLGIAAFAAALYWPAARADRGN